MSTSSFNKKIILPNPQDKLDASNCRQLINQVKAACKQNKHPVMLDMSQVRLISNCGLLALNLIAEHLCKASLPPVQLLNLQPHIKQVLAMSGFSSYAEIISSKRSVTQSFTESTQSFTER